ncbi:hypothetical protein L1887_09168 [Cichorium endivia]|nr:hypothetical protein L1887_09168 [Cichorium endivia]
MYLQLSVCRQEGLPTHLKAVSAMKGSREKRGEVPPVKLKNGSKSSRGSKGKEKKQIRKHGGNSSSMGYKSHEHEEEEEEAAVVFLLIT